MIKLDDLLGLSSSRLISGTADRFTGVATNSNDVRTGQVFFALLGARDGHEFLDAAIAAGARAVVVSRPYVASEPDVAVVEVPDTLLALQELAAGVRAGSDVDAIAVTGSVGKTTMKNLLQHLLSPHGQVLASPKSYNNHIGVPLTLLSLRPGTTDLIAEIGTNHPGEIGRLVSLVRPRVGIVTNVGHAHLGNFGSRADLAAEKASLFAGVEPGGVWMLNADDPHLLRAVEDLARPDGTRIITFGYAEEADVRVSDVRVSSEGTHGVIRVHGEQRSFEFPLVGRHFGSTVAGAIAVATERGVGIDAAIEAIAGFAGSEGRSAVSMVRSGSVRLLDDSYNGSPDSMLAALDTLSAFPEERRVAVLGEMRELGDWSARLHHEVGRRVADCATHLIFVGPSYQVVREAALDAGLPSDRIQQAGSATEAAARLIDLLETDPEQASAVLLKGARFVHMERVALALDGVRVDCRLDLCELYIHCSTCPKLHDDAGPDSDPHTDS